MPSRSHKMKYPRLRRGYFIFSVGVILCFFGKHEMQEGSVKFFRKIVISPDMKERYLVCKHLSEW